MLLLKQNITKKRQVDKNITKFEFDSNKEEYKVEEISKNAVYVKE